MDNLSHPNRVRAGQPAMPNLVPHLSHEDINSIKNDFIRHPHQYPLQTRRLRKWHWSDDDTSATIGLSFHSSRHFRAGSHIEVSIPLRGESQTFVGTVVLVREQSEGYEIGLWLRNDADAARIRIVEKICHTECLLKTRHHRHQDLTPAGSPLGTQTWVNGTSLS